MSFCPKCGSHMDAEDLFCQHCGFKVVRTAPAADEDDKTVMALPKRGNAATAANASAEPAASPGLGAGGTRGQADTPPFSAETTASRDGFRSGPRVEPQAAAAGEPPGLLGRAKRILLSPKSEWPVIAAESPAPAALMTSYVLPLAAIGPLAQFIGLVLIGMSVPFVGTIRIGVLPGLGMMVSTYVLGLAALFVMAWIANVLAPTFGGVKNSAQALKLIAYAYTPAWLAGILGILPWLGILAALASLYGLYLLYLGLPVMMRCPREKSLGYTALLVVLGIVAGIAISLVTQLFIPTPSMVSGSSVDPSNPAAAVLGGLAGKGGEEQIEAMARKMEEAGKKMDEAQKSGDTAAAVAAAGETLGALISGGRKGEPVDFRELKALLPDEVAGLRRTDAKGEKAGMGGFNISAAEARYGDGSDRSIEIKITDMGGTGMGMAAMAAWSMVEMDQETEDGHEKSGKLDGRPFHEKYNREARSGEFALVVGQRFLVEANGDKVEPGTLKSAATGVNLAKLESMKDAGAGN